MYKKKTTKSHTAKSVVIGFALKTVVFLYAGESNNVYLEEKGLMTPPPVGRGIRANL